MLCIFSAIYTFAIGAWYVAMSLCNNLAESWNLRSLTELFNVR